MKASNAAGRKAGLNASVNVAPHQNQTGNNTSANFYDHKTYIKILHSGKCVA